MKKWKNVVLLFLSAALLVVLTACGGSSANPYVKDTVIVEENGIKITLVGLSYNSSIFGPEVKFRFENTTNRNLTVQARNTSVNGYTVNPVMSVEVGAGEKTYGTLMVFQSMLDDCGIRRIETLRTKFHVFYSETYMSYFETESITLNFK